MSGIVGEPRGMVGVQKPSKSISKEEYMQIFCRTLSKLQSIFPSNSDDQEIQYGTLMDTRNQIKETGGKGKCKWPMHPRWDPSVLRTYPEALQLKERLLMERRMKAWRNRHQKDVLGDNLEDEASYISDEENMEPLEEGLEEWEVRKVEEVTKQVIIDWEREILRNVMTVLKGNWKKTRNPERKDMYNEELVGMVIEEPSNTTVGEELTEQDLEYIEQFVEFRSGERAEKRKQRMKARRAEKESSYLENKKLIETLRKALGINPNSSTSPLSLPSPLPLSIEDLVVVEQMKRPAQVLEDVNTCPVDAGSSSPKGSIDSKAMGDRASVKSMGAEVKDENLDLMEKLDEVKGKDASLGVFDDPVDLEHVLSHPWIQKLIRRTDSSGNAVVMNVRYADLPSINSDSTRTILSCSSDWDLESFEQEGYENVAGEINWDFDPEETAILYQRHSRETIEMNQRQPVGLYRKNGILKPRRIRPAVENMPLDLEMPVELPEADDEDVLPLEAPKFLLKQRKYQWIHRRAHRRRRDQRGVRIQEDCILEEEGEEDSEEQQWPRKSYWEEEEEGKGASLWRRAMNYAGQMVQEVLGNQIPNPNSNPNLNSEIRETDKNRMNKTKKSRSYRNSRAVRNFLKEQLLLENGHGPISSQLEVLIRRKLGKLTTGLCWYDNLDLKVDLLCDCLESNRSGAKFQFQKTNIVGAEYQEKMVEMVSKRWLLPVAARYPEKLDLEDLQWPDEWENGF